MLVTRKAICLITLLNLSAHFCSWSQIGPSTNALAFPSANNTFLGREGTSGETVDADLYTGAALVSIPIYTLTGKHLNVPVSLTYSAGSGVKLQDYATQVGLGWQLNAGGNISRVVRGFPDENSNGYLGGGWGTILNNSAGNMSSLTTAQQTAISYNNYQVPTADGEPDLFYVSTPYFSFQFTFDGSGNPVYSNNTGIKIKFVNYTSFVVTDDQGNQYFFGSSSLSVEKVTTTIYGTSYTFPTTWYLDKIIPYNGEETITLTYQAGTNNDYNYHYCTTFAYDSSHSAYTTNSTPVVNTFINPKYVSTIVTSQGTLTFNYAFDRMDDHNAARLSSIAVSAFNPQTQSNSTALSTYNFNYFYFGDPSTDTNVLRLCLGNISITGNAPPTSVTLNTLYSFTYDQANTLPSRQSQDFDFWGYYTTFNPTTANPMITPSVRQPNLALTMTDVLTGVSDLQGETWNIGYELNTYYNSGNVTIGGLRVNQLSKTWNGKSLFTKYIYTDNNNNSTGQIYNSIDSAGHVYNSPYNYLTYLPDGPTITGYGVNYSESPYLTYDLVGNFVGYSSVKTLNQNQSYSIFKFSNFNTTGCQDFATSDSNLIVMASSKAYKRGLLLEKTLYSAANNMISDDTYSYSSLNNPVTKNSWGYHWLVTSSSLSWCGVYVLGTCVGTDYEGVTDPTLSSSYCTYVENYRLTGVVHKDFDQLTPANSVATSTTYTYDHLSDPANTNRFIDSVTTTDSKGVKVIQTNYYAPDIANTSGMVIPMLTTAETSAINTMVNAGRTGAVIHSVDNRNGTINQVHNSYATASNNNIYQAATSAYASDPANTTSTLIKKQLFTFDPITSNLISSSAIGGDTTAAFYGYGSTLPIARIVNASSINTPSVNNAVSSVQIPNGTNSVTQTIPFTIVANGTLTISLVWPDLPAAGTSNYATVSYSITGPAGFVPPGNASICISSNNFCSAYTNQVNSPFACVPGNYVLTITGSQNPENNLTIFDVTYPGSLTSSFTNEFFYEGFEQIGTTSTYAHTGNLGYGGSYTVPFTPPPGRSYLIQWWNYTGTAWAFNQQAYTGPITITGTIDDVRVFPKDALMTTYTYNPLVGKTSEMDPSGRSVVYQYDGLNRLMTVRDQDNNILKQYDYEYQSCAQSVYNTIQTGSFIKNNCTSGLYGTVVIDTVPANKYSACSVTAANQLAASDVAYNGQNNANAKGSCTTTAPCSAPTTVTAVASGTIITVTWNYPPGVGTNAYAVYVKNPSTGATIYDNYGVASPLTINSTSILSNTTYAVTVLSLCGSDPSSSPVSVTTGATSGTGTAITVNLVNAASPPSGFCCFGCQYTSTVYTATGTIGPGTQLYTNSTLTTPVSGMTYVFAYTGNPNDYIYALSGNTVQAGPIICP